MTKAKMSGHARRDLIARMVDAGMPMLGVVIVLAAVLLGGGGWAALWMAVAGLLMVEAGVWRLGSRVVYERRYQPLRGEVQRFVGLARALHHAALAARSENRPEAREELFATVETMRASLDRMVQVAGKTESDLEAEVESAVPAAAATR